MAHIQNRIAGLVGFARVASRQIYARYFGSLEHRQDFVEETRRQTDLDRVE